MTSASQIMTPYQNLCEKLLQEIINSYDIETLSLPAFKVTVKALIRHYPEFNMDNQNPYKEFSLYKRYFRFIKGLGLNIKKTLKK
jgi:hypothetical protein